MTLMLMILIMIFNGCQTDLENGVYPNDSDPMIDEFLSENTSTSDFLQLIDRADLRGMSHAYGTYTCFAPTNLALQSYFNNNNLSLETISKEEAAYLVKYHFVSDTLSTSDFNESRLDALNMAKQYLSTKTELDSDNNIIIKVNSIANIVSPNNRLGNEIGRAHV